MRNTYTHTHTQTQTMILLLIHNKLHINKTIKKNNNNNKKKQSFFINIYVQIYKKLQLIL